MPPKSLKADRASPGARFIHTWTVWFLVALGLSITGGLVVTQYARRTLNERIRVETRELLARHYRGMHVEVRSAFLEDQEGIVLRDVSISPPERGAEPWASAEEIRLRCPVGWRDLLERELHIRQIVVRGLRLRMIRQADGAWSTSRLLPLPKWGVSTPEVRVESGSVFLHDPTCAECTGLPLRDLQVTLGPWKSAEGVASRDYLAMAGSMVGDDFKKVEFAGYTKRDGSQWSVAGAARGVGLAPQLFARLPGHLRGQLQPLQNVEGAARLDFRLAYADQKPLQFAFRGELRHGRIVDARLPEPLTDVDTVVQCDNSGVRFERFSARHGAAVLTLAGHCQGHSTDAPLDFSIECRQLLADSRWLDAMPDKWRELWRQFQPQGRFHVTARVVSDGERLRPSVRVACEDLSFQYEKFPYRLEHGQGEIVYENDELNVALTAYGGRKPVRIQARAREVSTAPAWNLILEGQHWNVDESLLAALPQAPREVVQSLDPRGQFSYSLRFWREGPQSPPRRAFHLIVHEGGEMRYAKFPYRLTNVSGVVRVTDANWEFNGFRARNDSGVIRCDSGTFRPIEGGHELVLQISGTNVPLDDELRDALRDDVRRLWDQAQPSGKVDLRTTIRYTTADKAVQVSVEGAPHGDSVTLEPRRFPVRLEHVQGHFCYERGVFQVTCLKGDHGPITFAAHVEGQSNPTGGWQLGFRDLCIERLSLARDRDVIAALPERLRRTLGELNPAGHAALRGRLDLSQAIAASSPLLADWNLALELQQATCDIGSPLSNLQGGMQLVGQWDGRQFRCRGELNLDSLHFKDVQFTNVRGPMWFDDSQILWGAPAVRRGEPPRHVTAHSAGGRLELDGSSIPGPQRRFQLRASFADGDLERMAREIWPGEQRLTGKLYGQLSLAGEAGGVHTLHGGGTIQLRDADIYQLPVMVALLKIVSVRVPDATAFTKSDIRFRVDGGHMYFDQVDFNGDAISLRGKGHMSPGAEIDLIFYPVVGRDEIRVPIVSDVLGGASQQAMLIHVAGSLDNPQTWTEAFPAVKEALAQLQMIPPESINRPPPPRTGLLSGWRDLFAQPKSLFGGGERR